MRGKGMKKASRESKKRKKKQVGGMGMKFDLDSPAAAEKGKVRF